MSFFLVLIVSKFPSAWKYAIFKEIYVRPSLQVWLVAEIRDHRPEGMTKTGRDEAGILDALEALAEERYIEWSREQPERIVVKPGVW